MEQQSCENLSFFNLIKFLKLELNSLINVLQKYLFGAIQRIGILFPRNPFTCIRNFVTRLVHSVRTYGPVGFLMIQQINRYGPVGNLKYLKLS